VDALVVWTGIRSNLKGSIEAEQKGDPLTEADFLNTAKFGKRRCLLDPEQRSTVYQHFERYEKSRRELELWDDCARVAATLHRIINLRSTDELRYREVCYSKIYVDEVQDYTQAEIALFFLLSGPNDLFLAGDPAQSVVEGVTFRFEEVRSVGYNLYKDNKSLCKPLQVNLNFRSHSGILNVAGAVLLRLFCVFPDSATKTKPDSGIFRGPRPSIFHHVEILRLKEAVTKLDGVVVLTHDENVSQWKRLLAIRWFTVFEKRKVWSSSAFL
jgi:superfamily I DNA/RNA helicase